MSRRRRSFAGRDQHVSAFGATLIRLCDALPAIGAALVDSEGETVDYAGTVDPFDIKVAAAECRILLSTLRASRVPHWNEASEIRLRGARKSFYIYALAEGYAVVMQLLPHAFNVSRRALAEAARELCAEGGLQLPTEFARERDMWWRVEVRCDDADLRRPSALWVDGTWCGVEVIGLYAEDLSPRESGYRARLESGAEITLVREPLGRWYADTRIGR